MPNCVSFTRKLNGQRIVTHKDWCALDAEIAEHFGDKAHEEKWYYYWYEIIAQSIAFGKTYAQIKAQLNEALESLKKEVPPYERDIRAEERRIAICDWLEANFTCDAWAEIGK